jgi:hypothetical protein
VTQAALTYLLPLRSERDVSGGELTRYLESIAGLASVIVVDGSSPSVFEAHHARWSDLVRHVPPDPRFSCSNGKVAGVLTGLTLTETDKAVIADDDVRYDAGALGRVERLLDDHDLVRPQNFFDPLPWHARWDTARSLLNRSFGRDYPGTLGVRTETLRRAGGYDGDVMFENLELMRTIDAVNGRAAAPLDFFVRRFPPDTRHFLDQRVRQAFDELALPVRMIAFLSVAPLCWVFRRRPRQLGSAALLLVATAELGRRRGHGETVFPPSTSWFAPLWVLERGVCMWIALAQRVVYGGVPYRGGVIRRAATPSRRLRRRLQDRRLSH